MASGHMGTISNPLNDSKGCGGVIRVAPVALRYIPEDENDSVFHKVLAEFFSGETDRLTIQLLED